MTPEARQRYEMPPSAALLETEHSKRQTAFGLWELTKPRLSFLSVTTALIAYLAARPDRDTWGLIHFLCGTALAAGGAAALNQWMERRTDAVMERTKSRPLPTGLVMPAQAVLWGLFLSIAGVTQLWFGANPLAGILGLSTIVSYIAIYTPLKQRSRWATELGAISGALPPLIGWAAAEGRISALGWIFFGILFFWQIPHFMAIAWTYRRDYASVSFPMLSVVDPEGGRVARWSLVHAVLLVLVSLLPSLLGFTGPAYLVVAAILGIRFLILAGRFLRTREREASARRLFLYSILYLPLLLAALLMDRWLA
jgi:protoheme IX farnesyltransferase